MRVVSLLPSATELLFAAGGGDLLVGRSHECDFPAGALAAPVLTSARIAHTAAADAPAAVDEAAIDAAVRASLASGDSLYRIDEELLRTLAPDVILTQDLCEVCSIDLRSVERIAATLANRPRVVNLNPTTVWQVLDDLLAVGGAVGRAAAAQAAATQLRDRLWTAAEQGTPFTDGPGVLFLEWTDPPFVGGHWTPELIALAGGAHPLNAAGAKSRIATPDEIVASAPALVAVAPCGLPLAAVRESMRSLERRPWWNELPAVRTARADLAAGRTPRSVMLVDGNQMFNRPGPRLIDGLEWLAAWIQGRPDLAPHGFPAEAWRPTA